MVRIRLFIADIFTLSTDLLMELRASHLFRSLHTVSLVSHTAIVVLLH